MNLPRFLWVPFELGRPFGTPNEPDFQRRVLHAALSLLERESGPTVLADFPDDAPATHDEIVWACPVSFTPDTGAEKDLPGAARAEMARLAAWAELAPAPRPNSAMTLDDMITLLAEVTENGSAGAPTGDRPLLESLRLAADDLRTWYLHAALQQPGSADSAARTDWFWRETAMGRLLGALAARLRDDPDPALRAFAERAVVPRDHWAIVPESPSRTGGSDE